MVNFIPSPPPDKTRGMKHVNFLSKSEDADFDIRRACNLLKKTSAVLSACIITKASPATLMTQIEQMSISILEKLGFNVDDKAMTGALLAMVSEPVSLVLYEATMSGATNEFMLANAGRVIAAMTEFARSKIAAKLIDERYPNDIHVTTALRMSMAKALTPVMVEVSRFDFFQGESSCIKEASKVISKSAFEAADFIADKDASVSGQAMLTQTLLHSAGMLYSSCYKESAVIVKSSLMKLEVADRVLETERMSALPPHEVFKAITHKFHEMFDECINATMEIDMPTPFMAAPLRRKP